jgi:ABC-type branched-subunit amino acid transport system ATPase component
MTVRENLTLCGANPETDGPDFAACLPKFRGLLDRKAGTLSGGEKRIIAILSAIIAGPRVLIVDEFTEGLYPNALDALSKSLERFASRGNVALLMVHSFEALQKFGFRKAKLLDGEISTLHN